MLLMLLKDSPSKYCWAPKVSCVTGEIPELIDVLSNKPDEEENSGLGDIDLAGSDRFIPLPSDMSW